MDIYPHGLFFFILEAFLFPTTFFFPPPNNEVFHLTPSLVGQTREWENLCLLPGREGLSMQPYVFAAENQNAYPCTLITAMQP